ncbi:MAG: glycosyltransferase involved in cell wall biosynthesis [Hyphomicrobiaceae bacterium]
MKPPELSIVVPVFNNQRTLPELIRRLLLVLETVETEWEAVFVDDGSQDESRRIIADHAAQEPRIRLVELARNFGSQAALCAGFAATNGQKILCMDADLENLPEDIPALLAPLEEGHDLVCGYREQRQSSLLRRRLPSALLNAYVRRAVRRSARDIGCGMRAMNATVVANLDTEGEKRRMLSPLLLARAQSVAEVPIRHGTSPWPGGHTFLTLSAIAVDFWMVSSRRPFLALAVVAALFGGLCFVVAIATALAGFPNFALATWVTFLATVLTVVMCMVGEFIARLYELAQGRPFYVVRDDSHRSPQD